MQVNQNTDAEIRRLSYFVRTYMRLHALLWLGILLLSSLPSSPISLKVHFNCALMTSMFELGCVMLHPMLGSLYRKGKLSVQVYVSYLRMIEVAWLLSAPVIHFNAVGALFRPSPELRSVLSSIVQMLVVHQAFVLIRGLRKFGLYSGIAIMLPKLLVSPDQSWTLILLQASLLSLLTVMGIIIAQHSSYKQTVDIEMQTEHLPPPQPTFDTIWSSIHKRYPHPMFMIDLNINTSETGSPAVNDKAQELLRARNCRRAEAFLGSLTLETLECTVMELVGRARRKVEQQFQYRDSVTLLSGDQRQTYDVLLFTFEHRADSSHTNFRGRKAQGSLGSDVLPMAKAEAATEVEEAGRYMVLVLAETRKDLREEKTILENFKGSLICSLSHELCTPLNTILNVLTMMPQCPSKDGLHDLKEVALDSTEMMHSKVLDLIDYTQIELHRFRPVDRTFCVNDLFEELERLFSYEARERHNRLVFSVRPQDKMWILADRARIRQVLVKLIFNANKYSSNATVTVSATEDPLNFDILFEVADTGCGISQAQLELILSNVSEKARLQANQHVCSTKLPGLGLTIARKICECMNSQLKARSQEGVGSVFYFKMPTCKMVGVRHGEEDEEAPISNPHRRSRIRFLRQGSQWDLPLLLPKKLKQRLQRDEDVKTLKPPDIGAHLLGNDDSASRLTPREDTTLPSSQEKLALNPNDLKRCTTVGTGTTPIPTLALKGNLLVRRGPERTLTPTDTVPEQSLLTTQGASTQRKSKVVLVADDYPANRLVLNNYLARLNVPVVETENGHETYKYVVQSFQPSSQVSVQLILMDVEMPVMGGIQATMKIRSLETKMGKEQPIPIAAVTAFNSETSREACFDAGMQYFLPKPVKFSLLKPLVQKYCQP